MIKPKKTKGGEVEEEGKVAEFHNFYYETNVQEDIDILKKSSSFGNDFWEYGAPTPSGVKAPVSHGGNVETTPSEKEKKDKIDLVEKRFGKIEDMIINLASAVDRLAKGNKAVPDPVIDVTKESNHFDNKQNKDK